MHAFENVDNYGRPLRSCVFPTFLPFLLDLPGIHVPSGSVLPSQPGSSSRENGKDCFFTSGVPQKIPVFPHFDVCTFLMLIFRLVADQSSKH